MGYVLDTSVLIEIENDNKAVLAWLSSLDEDEAFITFFSYCEFFYGFMNKSEINQKKAQEQLAKYHLLLPTQKTAHIFCQLIHNSKKKGIALAEFDGFIAAQCLEHKHILLTLDKNFQKITELKVQSR